MFSLQNFMQGIGGARDNLIETILRGSRARGPATNFLGMNNNYLYPQAMLNDPAMVFGGVQGQGGVTEPTTQPTNTQMPSYQRFDQQYGRPFNQGSMETKTYDPASAPTINPYSRDDISGMRVKQGGFYMTPRGQQKPGMFRI